MAYALVTHSLAALEIVEVVTLHLEDVLDIIATPGRRLIVQSRRSTRQRDDGTPEGTGWQRPVSVTTAVDLDTHIAYRASHEGSARSLAREACALNPQSQLLARRERINPVGESGSLVRVDPEFPNGGVVVSKQTLVSDGLLFDADVGA